MDSTFRLSRGPIKFLKGAVVRQCEESVKSWSGTCKSFFGVDSHFVQWIHPYGEKTEGTRKGLKLRSSVVIMARRHGHGHGHGHAFTGEMRCLAQMALCNMDTHRQTGTLQN